MLLECVREWLLKIPIKENAVSHFAWCQPGYKSAIYKHDKTWHKTNFKIMIREYPVQDMPFILDL